MMCNHIYPLLTGCIISDSESLALTVLFDLYLLSLNLPEDSWRDHDGAVVSIDSLTLIYACVFPFSFLTEYISELQLSARRPFFQFCL